MTTYCCFSSLDYVTHANLVSVRCREINEGENMDKQSKVNNRDILGKKIWSLQSQGDTATLLPQYNTQTHTCYNSETNVLQQ